MDNYTPHSGSPLERLSEEISHLEATGAISKLLSHSPDLVNRIKEVFSVLMNDGVHDASNFRIGDILQSLNEDMLELEDSEYPNDDGIHVDELHAEEVIL